jgi:F0F1-type ATP synthase epsilon subunit
LELAYEYLGGGRMIEEDALYILRNTAWLGSNEKREEVEKAVETLAEALNLQQSDEEKSKEEKEIKDAYSSYLLVPNCDRMFY